MSSQQINLNTNITLDNERTVCLNNFFRFEWRVVVKYLSCPEFLKDMKIMPMYWWNAQQQWAAWLTWVNNQQIDTSFYSQDYVSTSFKIFSEFFGHHNVISRDDARIVSVRTSTRRYCGSHAEIYQLGNTAGSGVGMFSCPLCCR